MPSFSTCIYSGQCLFLIFCKGTRLEIVGQYLFLGKDSWKDNSELRSGLFPIIDKKSERGKRERKRKASLRSEARTAMPVLLSLICRIATDGPAPLTMTNASLTMTNASLYDRLLRSPWQTHRILCQEAFYFDFICKLHIFRHWIVRFMGSCRKSPQ